MDWLTITGVRPYDGRYEFDIEGSEFTTREWGWIKRHSGYLPLTVEDGFKGADPELISVFAVIALHRAGKIQVGDVPDVVDRLADAPAIATIRLETDSEEVTEVNPPPSPESSSLNGSTSGGVSPTSSGSPDPGLSRSGILASDTSGSDPARSAT